MEKLGLKPPPIIEIPKEDNKDSQTTSELCENGVCTLPSVSTENSSVQSPQHIETATRSTTLIPEEEVIEVAERVAKSMNVHRSLALAALSATATTSSEENGKMFDEQAARLIIQQELDLIEQIPYDSPQVHTLTGEGFDPFLSRRALAFAEGNMDDARAILLADKEDEEQEEEMRKSLEQASRQQEREVVFPTVTIDTKIDPTQLPAPVKSTTTGQPMMPKPARKEDVVFEATSSTIQELVLESPVPVLLDVYADWCGPCKALTPALEDMAQKSGGIFRLVKVNTDKERPISTALEVTALPTVFGVKNGKVVHMFQGMPSSEQAMKSFMMGLLVDESSFSPPLTNDQKEKYRELTTKMAKMAGIASFPFSARERLQDRVATLLDKLVDQVGNDASKAEESAKVVRSLLSNIIRNPSESKYRTIKLSNAVMLSKIAPFQAARSLLKSVGFQQHLSSSGPDNVGDEIMTLAANKKFVNVAPLTIAVDSIDKWIDKSRYEIAKAARKRKDEEERARLHAEGAFGGDKDEGDYDVVDSSSDSVNSNACLLKVRLAGKKKVYSLSLAATDSLATVLQQIPIELSGDKDVDEGSEEVQIICAAKKMVIKSSDTTSMEEKTLEELGLTPTASLVVDVKKQSDTAKTTIETTTLEEKEDTKNEGTQSKLRERAALQKKRKMGSHTMQSVGIYAKDDNNKAELIDGGGGVWYEHDVSDDDEDQDKDNHHAAEEQ